MVGKVRRESLVRLFLAGALCVATQVHAQNVDFDSAGDLQNEFNIQPGTIGTFYAQVPNGGITGGAVDVFATGNTTDTVFFNKATPSPGGVTLTTSLSFRYDAALRNTDYGFPLILGFSRSAANGIEAGAYLQIYNDTTNRVIPVIFGANNETHAGPGGTLTSGNWYRLTSNLQSIGGTGRAVVSASLVDYGPSGTQPQFFFPAFSQEILAFSGNSPVALFPAFRAFKTGGADLLDNFSVATGSTLPSPGRVANLSTRGRVGQGDDTLIGGVIVQGDTSRKVIVRAIGPSLSPLGVPGAVDDPVLSLFDASGNQIAHNDNWRSDQEQEILETHLAPTNDKEAAILITLAPGNYTAVVRGANGATGIGLVEVYDLQ